MDPGPRVQDLLPIGRFAQLARLSPKALRLYGDLGLLTPAHTDPDFGYRYYRQEQLGQARLRIDRDRVLDGRRWFARRAARRHRPAC